MYSSSTNHKILAEATNDTMKFEENFGTPIIVDSTDSEKEDDHNRNILTFHRPPYMFNRDTCQMSPLLFESDTDDTLQPTEIECYQRRNVTPQLSKPSNRDIFEILSALKDLRKQTSSSPLGTPSQHNQCCSETLLKSSVHRSVNKKTINTDNAYISPSPRVTRSRFINSRILTRSSKRLHKISELNTTASKRTRTRREVDKGKKGRTKRNSNNGNDKGSTPGNNNDQEMLIEPMQNSQPKVDLQRVKNPGLENTMEMYENFIQPNIVPNIELHDKCDNDLDFLNRRTSSDVQIISPKRTIISLSSESSYKSAKIVTNECDQRYSPDLFENCSASNLCSQSSFDIPNGQILLSSQSKNGLTNTTPNGQHSPSNTPSFVDIFDNHSITVVEAAKDKLLDQTNNKFADNVFEITTNDMFPNVIQLDSDSESSHLSPLRNTSSSKDVREMNRAAVDNLIDLSKCSSTQEVTPKRMHSFRSLLEKSLQETPLRSPLQRSKWLTKRSPSNGDHSLLNKTPNRCRRLDLWFQDNEGEPTSTKLTSRKGETKKICKTVLSSSEDDES